ncbi:hypothetical protein IJ750_05590 [bacterium]|nr:hypothetical protein [bacterium]
MMASIKEDGSNFTAAAWREKVYIETTEHIIKGYVFMPKIGKRARMLSEILNTNKQFVAVTDCQIEFKLIPQREVERYEFMQVNLASILLMRPLDD